MKVTVHNVDQRSDEWHTLRLGRLTGSRAADAIATIKTGEAAARRDYRIELVAERLTGQSAQVPFSNPDTERGVELEPEARDAYVARAGTMIDETGFIACDDLMAGCSLDGSTHDFKLIVEIKCPRPANHLEIVQYGVPKKYLPQITHNLWVSGADECDFVSYCPVFPAPLHLSIHRVTRLDVDIPKYEEQALLFLAEVEGTLSKIKEML